MFGARVSLKQVLDVKEGLLVLTADAININKKVFKYCMLVSLIQLIQISSITKRSVLLIINIDKGKSYRRSYFEISLCN